MSEKRMNDKVQSVDETIAILDSLRQKLLDNKDNIDFSRRVFKTVNQYEEMSHEIIKCAVNMSGYAIKNGLLKECKCADECRNSDSTEQVPAA